MQTVDVHEAGTCLCRLVESLESGAEDEILITHHGRAVARLTRLETVDAGRRIGVARGRFDVPDDIDTHNDAVARLFGA